MTHSEVLAALGRLTAVSDRHPSDTYPDSYFVRIDLTDLRACAVAIEIIEEYIAFLDRIPTVSTLTSQHGGAAPFESVPSGTQATGSTEAAAVAGETSGPTSIDIKAAKCVCGSTFAYWSTHHKDMLGWYSCAFSALVHGTARDRAIAEAARRYVRAKDDNRASDGLYDHLADAERAAWIELRRAVEGGP